MAKGNNILQKGIPHVGEKYVYGAPVPKNNSQWKGPWDCAEFVSWCVFQATEKLYGCDNDHGNPATADAYTGYWQNDVSRLGIRISLELAAKTPGAIILRYPITHPKTDGHIVISDGKGGTVEAKSRIAGVVTDVLANRRWDTGILIPGVEYGQNSGAVIVTEPNLIFRLTTPLMRGNIVKEIQRKLKAQTPEINPGNIDGIYGPNTIVAVIAFQRLQGLVVDGEVGPETAQALGIDAISNL